MTDKYTTKIGEIEFCVLHDHGGSLGVQDMGHGWKALREVERYLVHTVGPKGYVIDRRSVGEPASLNLAETPAALHRW